MDFHDGGLLGPIFALAGLVGVIGFVVGLLLGVFIGRFLR